MRGLRYVVIASLLGIAIACKDDPVQQGEIVVVVQTDVALPDSIDKIRLEVIAHGLSQYANEFDVGPAPALRIPATLGLLQGRDPATPVQVRLTGRKAGKVKMPVPTMLVTTKAAAPQVPSARRR